MKCFGAMLPLVCCLAIAAGETDRPNIVLFISDDLGQLDTSPYGAAQIRTPHLAQLAERGMLFTHAFVASPSCAPSRAALLTGMMPARNGAEANHSKPRAEIKKWPAYFQDLGYEVAAFGKVSHYKHTPDYGFDHFAHDTFHDHAGIPAAVEYLRKRDTGDAKPLCLLVGTNWPHVPWPADFGDYDPAQLSLPAGSVDTPLTRQWRARYAAAVTKADDDLGAIVAAARQTLGENMLFAFTSDHGAQWPLGKWNCYDAGIRVPLIVCWPEVIKPQSHTPAMVSWVDLLPTLLEAAGGKPPSDIDGRSFLPTLRGEQAAHRSRIFTTHTGDGRWNIYPIRSVRTQDWKYIRNLHPEFAFTTHIDLPAALGQRSFWSTWEMKAKTDARAAALVTRYHARPAEELYDLAADPHEQRNLAAEPAHARLLARLRSELDAWMREQGDRRLVAAAPRLLSDPHSYGPNARGGNPAKTTKRSPMP